MMHTVSEGKTAFDLKNTSLKMRNNMAELNKQFGQSNLSAIEELNMRYVKQFSEKFVWFAAVGYDMVPEAVATNWKLLPEKIVPAVIQGWNVSVRDSCRLLVEPIDEETVISGRSVPATSQHFLTLLYWMPISSINTIFRNKYLHYHVGGYPPELLRISEYQGYPILGISQVKFNK